MNAADREPVALAAFLAGTAFAGGNAVAIRFSNRDLDPSGEELDVSRSQRRSW